MDTKNTTNTNTFNQEKLDENLKMDLEYLFNKFEVENMNIHENEEYLNDIILTISINLGLLKDENKIESFEYIINKLNIQLDLNSFDNNELEILLSEMSIQSDLEIRGITSKSFFSPKENEILKRLLLDNEIIEYNIDNELKSKYLEIDNNENNNIIDNTFEEEIINNSKEKFLENSEKLKYLNPIFKFLDDKGITKIQDSEQLEKFINTKTKDNTINNYRNELHNIIIETAEKENINQKKLYEDINKRLKITAMTFHTFEFYGEFNKEFNNFLENESSLTEVLNDDNKFFNILSENLNITEEKDTLFIDEFANKINNKINTNENTTYNIKLIFALNKINKSYLTINTKEEIEKISKNLNNLFLDLIKNDKKNEFKELFEKNKDILKDKNIIFTLDEQIEIFKKYPDFLETIDLELFDKNHHNDNANELAQTILELTKKNGKFLKNIHKNPYFKNNHQQYFHFIITLLTLNQENNDDILENLNLNQFSKTEQEQLMIVSKGRKNNKTHSEIEEENRIRTIKYDGGDKLWKYIDLNGNQKNIDFNLHVNEKNINKFKEQIEKNIKLESLALEQVSNFQDAYSTQKQRSQSKYTKDLNLADAIKDKIKDKYIKRIKLGMLYRDTNINPIEFATNLINTGIDKTVDGLAQGEEGKKVKESLKLKTEEDKNKNKNNDREKIILESLQQLQDKEENASFIHNYFTQGMAETPDFDKKGYSTKGLFGTGLKMNNIQNKLTAKSFSPFKDGVNKEFNEVFKKNFSTMLSKEGQMDNGSGLGFGNTKIMRKKFPDRETLLRNLMYSSNKNYLNSLSALGAKNTKFQGIHKLNESIASNNKILPIDNSSTTETLEGKKHFTSLLEDDNNKAFNIQQVMEKITKKNILSNMKNNPHYKHLQLNENDNIDIIKANINKQNKIYEIEDLIKKKKITINNENTNEQSILKDDLLTTFLESDKISIETVNNIIDTIKNSSDEKYIIDELNQTIKENKSEHTIQELNEFANNKLNLNNYSSKIGNIPLVGKLIGKEKLQFPTENDGTYFDDKLGTIHQVQEDILDICEGEIKEENGKISLKLTSPTSITKTLSENYIQKYNGKYFYDEENNEYYYKKDFKIIKAKVGVVNIGKGKIEDNMITFTEYSEHMKLLNNPTYTKKEINDFMLHQIKEDNLEYMLNELNYYINSDNINQNEVLAENIAYSLFTNRKNIDKEIIQNTIQDSENIFSKILKEKITKYSAKDNYQYEAINSLENANENIISNQEKNNKILESIIENITNIEEEKVKLKDKKESLEYQIKGKEKAKNDMKYKEEFEMELKFELEDKKDSLKKNIDTKKENLKEIEDNMNNTQDENEKNYLEEKHKKLKLEIIENSNQIKALDLSIQEKAKKEIFEMEKKIKSQEEIKNITAEINKNDKIEQTIFSDLYETSSEEISKKIKEVLTNIKSEDKSISSRIEYINTTQQQLKQMKVAMETKIKNQDNELESNKINIEATKEASFNQTFGLNKNTTQKAIDDNKSSVSTALKSKFTNFKETLERFGTKNIQSYKRQEQNQKQTQEQVLGNSNNQVQKQ